MGHTAGPMPWCRTASLFPGEPVTGEFRLEPLGPQHRLVRTFSDREQRTLRPATHSADQVQIVTEVRPP